MRKIRNKKLAQIGQILWPDKLRVSKCVSFNREDFSADELEEDSDSSTTDSLTSRFENSCDSSPEISYDHREASGKPLERGLSEILRLHWTQTQELRLAVGTWNVAGKFPPSNLSLDDWLKIENPADIYVIGFQEVVPLNAGNVLGAEDTRPTAKWESLIRQTLSKARNPVHAQTSKICRTTPCSPCNSSVLSSPEVSPLRHRSNALRNPVRDEEEHSMDNLSTLQHSSSQGSSSVQSHVTNSKQQLNQVYSNAEQLGLHRFIDRTESQPANRFTKLANPQNGDVRATPQGVQLHGALDTKCVEETEVEHFRSKLYPTILLERSRKKQKVEEYVRVASKQMVGIHVSVWLRRKFRQHIRSIRVSTVGIGLMGYLGNKGAVSVSLILYQTAFCFICTHLSHGGKEGDQLRRNVDVLEILKRTRFSSSKEHNEILPKTIGEHEHVIMLGDLNYRINLSDAEARMLVTQRKWQTLLQSDQLKKEIHQGKTFEGWFEGPICFGPTYKFEIDSDKYTTTGENSRTPAWCDRILWSSEGLKILSYGRTPSTLSDHKPVNAMFLAQVEVLSENKLMKMLQAWGSFPTMGRYEYKFKIAQRSERSSC